MKKDKTLIVREIWDAILNDSWMWMVVWGKPRTGKTTVQMKLAFQVYHDWDDVLQSFVYNLAQFLYKMDNGIPNRIMTRNKLHNRVPVLLLDDFGANANKAKTQHEPAWDIFKGAFDTLATKVAVLIASMGTPTALTQQIQEKYTHEIYCECKGSAKFDKVNWQQNFGGWQPKQKKDWQETFTFSEVPTDVYRQYDEMRMSLVDEVEQLIKDAMIESEVTRAIKRMSPTDVELLDIIITKGTITNQWVNDPKNKQYKESLTRLKARSLAVPLRRGTSYHYDVTDLGLEVHKTVGLLEAEQKEKLLVNL